jgi:hypothetical protein
MLQNGRRGLQRPWSPREKWVAFGVVLLVTQQLFLSSLSFVGFNSLSAPLDFQNGTVVDFTGIQKGGPPHRQLRLDGKHLPKSLTNASIRLAAFDDVHLSNQTRLSNTWSVVQSDYGLVKEQLNSNTCFKNSGLFRKSSVHCLPASYILGFEKCGTTILNIWLSYHPNLKTNWMEGRFFDLAPRDTLRNLDTKWHEYLPFLPKLPSSQIGKVWTFEKSPAYVTNPWAPEALSALVPDARLLIVTRNPTIRAYSMFLMYTRHYPNAGSAIRHQPVSFFVKNIESGDVRYIRDGFRTKANKRKKPLSLPTGVGGSLVPTDMAPTHDEWRYLSYPPDPRDFDNFIRHIVRKHKNKAFKNPFYLDRQPRDQRILTGGLYSTYLKEWLGHFESKNFVILPSEDFFAPDRALESLVKLQQLLGLPVFDYSTIVSRNPKTSRYEIPSSVGTMLNNVLNAYVGASVPMLNKTKEILDGFYCSSNRELSGFLGNRSLPGYSCADHSLL